MKNKNLLIIFIVLLVIYLGITFFGDKKESSFSDNIVDFKVENVDKIEITPKDNAKKPFELTKNGDKWKITVDDRQYDADNGIVENALNSMEKMKIKNIITKNPDKFAKYELEDGKCKRVKVFSKTKKLADVMIGKFKFDPQTRMASSYVRLSGKNEVYSTDGFSGINISDNLNTYRVKTIADFDPADLKSIKLNKGGVEKEIVKQGEDWTFGNIVLDSIKMKGYVSSLSKMKGSKFIEPVDVNNYSNPDQLVLQLEDNTIQIEAYPDTISAKGFVIHSSANKDAYFESDSLGIYKNIFGRIEDIIQEKEITR